MNPFSFIKQKVTILDVVTSYVSLKKAGLYWKGTCPFHQERTASFSVSPDKEIFYCFGCHVGGDVITFIAKIENCSALEAVQHLAAQYSIELPKDEQWSKKEQSVDEKNRYFALCTLFAQWTHACAKAYKPVQEYIAARSLSSESFTSFMLGYMPSGQKSIKSLLAYGQKEYFMAQDFIKAKLLLEGKHGLYSPFEERIIFPIKDHLGRICGFGGRIFKEEDERAKYYNSHDHELFNKSMLLFGLDKAKKHIQEQEKVFLVEGYTDVIAMVQHGFTNTVATLGTACTQDHLKLLARYAQKLYVLYDADTAGEQAIMRLVQLCWNASIDLHVVTLPKKEDPASFLARNGDLNSILEGAQDIFEFFIYQLGINFEQKSLQERVKLTKKLLDIIRLIPEQLKQDLLLQKASTRFSIPFSTLKKELGDPIDKPTVKTEQSVKDKPSHCEKITQLEKKLISAILYNKSTLAAYDSTLLSKWLPPLLKHLFDKAMKAHAESISVFDILTEEEKQHTSRLIIQAEYDPKSTSLEQLLLQFYKKQWKIIIHHAKIKIEQAQQEQNIEQVNLLLTRLELLKKKMLQRGVS